MLRAGWFFVPILFFLFACTSSPEIAEVEIQNDVAVSTKLPVLTLPETIFPTYFRTIDQDILSDIANGSPASLRQAVSALRNSDNSGSDQTKILLAICATIMQYAWPQENISWTVPTDLPNNVYTSTLESVNRGLYESSFEDSDFFSLTLPALVLLSNPTDTSYCAEEKIALEQSLHLDANSVLTLYLLGIANLRTGNSAKATEYLETALSFDSNNIEIICAYLDALLQNGNGQKAFEFAQSINASQSGNVQFLEYYAKAAFAVGDYTAAESLVSRALGLEPDNLSLLLFRAQILFELGNYLSVSTLLDVYSRTNAQNKDYLLLRSRLQYTWNKNTTSALRTLQEALTLYPDDTDVLLLAADLALASNQQILQQSPTQLLARVLEKEPENIGALEIAVRAAILNSDWQAAHDASITVLENKELTSDFAIMYAQICIELGLLNDAREALEAFYTPNTADENLQQWYIRLLIAEGDITQAQNLIDRLLPTATGSMRSILYFERSRLVSEDSQILADLRSSLAANPRNEFTLYGLYAYYYDRNDYSKAQYYLKQVIALNPSNQDFLQRNAELETLLN